MEVAFVDAFSCCFDEELEGDRFGFLEEIHSL